MHGDGLNAVDSTAFDHVAITEMPGLSLTNEQSIRFLHRYAMAAALAHDRTVLEVAFGGASGLRYLADLARAAVGLDYSRAVLEHARSTAVPTPLVRADACRLPFRHDTFDLVVCFEALYYLDDCEAFLGHCRRVLAPGGKLLLSWTNPESPGFVPGRFSNHYPTARAIANCLHRVGFQNVELSGILPVTEAGASAGLLSQARRLAARSHLIPHQGALADLLKRLAYGRLLALPAELDDAMVEEIAASVAPTPLTFDPAERRYKVLYAQATSPSDARD